MAMRNLSSIGGCLDDIQLFPAVVVWSFLALDARKSFCCKINGKETLEFLWKNFSGWSSDPAKKDA
jgi:hypothetical protein